jgi:hypothetical protein
MLNGKVIGRSPITCRDRARTIEGRSVIHLARLLPMMDPSQSRLAVDGGSYQEQGCDQRERHSCLIQRERQSYGYPHAADANRVSRTRNTSASMSTVARFERDEDDDPAPT